MTDINKKQLELNSLIEFSQLINTKLDLEFIFGNILLSVMGKMMIMKGAILIKNELISGKDYSFTVRAVKGINQDAMNKQIEFELPSQPIFTIADIKNTDFFTENNLIYFFKIYFVDKLIGILCLGKKYSGNELTKSELLFLETLLNLSSPTIENSIKFEEIKRLNSSLNSQIQHLRTLFELSKEFNSSFQERENILKLLKYSLLGNFGIRDYAIFSKDKYNNFIVSDKTSDFQLDEYTISFFNKISEPEVIPSESTSEVMNNLYAQGFRLILPLRRKDTIETIVCLGEKLNKVPFSVNDIQFLESLTNMTVISLNNIELFNQYLEKQKIESELKVAREIQLALLPEKIPNIKGFSVSACNIPAQHIGGDYYDVIKLDDYHFAFVIADVSGKGTPASLLMSNIQSAVHSFLKIYDSNFSLESITSKINELIYSNTSSEKFITFFWGILNIQKSTFQYVNAGHNPPYFISDNRIQTLDKGGIILGVVEGSVPYISGEVSFNSGDILFMFTDGVSEAKNNQGKDFSDERIIDLILKYRNANVEILKEALIKELKIFTADRDQFDDITIIALKKQ